MKLYELAAILAFAGLVLANCDMTPFGGGIAPPAEQGGGNVVTAGDSGSGGAGGVSVVGSSAGGDAGGNGGGIEAGAGGLGGIGGHPMGGSGGVGGMPDPDIILVWTLLPEEKNPGVYLSLGGVVDQPFGGDQLSNVFIDKNGKKCITSMTRDLTVVCNLGPLEKGTKLQLKLYTYFESDASMFAYFMCGVKSAQNDQCRGSLGVYLGDVKPANLLPMEFKDDKNQATPLPVPWAYVEVNTRMELFHPGLTW